MYPAKQESQFTPVGERLAALAATVSTPYTFPLLTTLAGTVVAIFVPSSGGQWAIQGLLFAALWFVIGVFSFTLLPA